VTTAAQRILAEVQAGLSRSARYDDESIVHPGWVRQRYDCGCFASYGPARRATVATAWHEAGHAVAALTVGARFSSASIRHSHGSEGRVNGIRGAGDLMFVVDAAGQVAERLRDWSLPDGDEDVAAWLRSWKGDGGDARRFRRGLAARFGGDESAAWRYSAELLTGRRLAVRQVARALLVHPRYLPYGVVKAIAATG